MVVGAGSASFGLSAVGGLLRRRARDLPELTLSLVDTDADGLEVMRRVAERAAPPGVTVRASVDRREVLEGADFVVISVARDREATWARDRALARSLGIEHYAENGGPGALMHTARSLGLVMPILRDVEALAPAAWVLQLTNPLPRLCRASALATSLRTLGLCHQIRFGYFVAAVALAEEIGVEVPANLRFRWDDTSVALERELSEQAMARVQIRAAGLNHFTWMLSVTERATGRELLPRLRERLRDRVNPEFEPLTRHLSAVTGQVPVSGDTHLSEYLGYTAAAASWSRYAIQPYDHAWSERVRRRQWALAGALAAGDAPPSALDALPCEGVEDVVCAVWNDEGAAVESVNVPNRGAIEGLADDTIVEVPATLHSGGAEAARVGPLPEPVAEWCRREAVVVDLSVRAVLEGDRRLALQALLLDPTVPGLDVAERLLDAYLAAEPRALEGWA